MKKIILVDDELSSIQKMISMLIDQYDLSFCMFKEDPLKAIEYIRNFDVSAAFLDINMPLINGINLAEKLIHINSNIKIIFITGYYYDKKYLEQKFKNNLLSIIEKPFTKEEFKKILDAINGDLSNYFLHTFGNFDLLNNNSPLNFYSKKSKELLALLVDRNGINVTMDEAICALWPDLDIDKSKILYRDAVWKLRKALKENNIENLVTFQRALLHINKIIPCDYWDFLKGNRKKFNGFYLSSYDWSLDTQTYLNSLIEY